MAGNSKRQGLASLGGLVYSTDQGRMCPDCEAPIDDCVCSESDAVLGSGKVVIGVETKGRKGKGVTLIKALAMTQSELELCAQKLKKHCGTGGSVKGAVIEIQGDQRLKIQTFLAGLNIKSVISGRI